MKTKLIKTVLALQFFAVMNSAHAGDAYDFVNYGFSPDGYNYSFGEHVTDDAATAFASVYVLDTKKNSFVRQTHISLEEQDGTEDAVQMATKSAKLSRYRINPSQPIGTELYSGPFTLTADIASLGSVVLDERIVPGVVDPNYALMDNPPEATKIFTLTLKREGKTPLVLQHDKALPKSRGYPYVYRIEKVYAHQGVIAVIVSYHTFGVLHGDNKFYLAVTGKLD